MIAPPAAASISPGDAGASSLFDTRVFVVSVFFGPGGRFFVSTVLMVDWADSASGNWFSAARCNVVTSFRKISGSCLMITKRILGGKSISKYQSDS